MEGWNARKKGRKHKQANKNKQTNTELFFSLSPWPCPVRRDWWMRRDYQAVRGWGAGSCLGAGRTEGRQRWSKSRNTGRLIWLVEWRPCLSILSDLFPATDPQKGEMSNDSLTGFRVKLIGGRKKSAVRNCNVQSPPSWKTLPSCKTFYFHYWPLQSSDWHWRLLSKIVNKRLRETRINNYTRFLFRLSGASIVRVPVQAVT